MYIGFGTLFAVVMTVWYQAKQFHPTPGTKCTKADIRLRAPDDGQKGCPKQVE
jgi:hypothetical protein